MASETQSMDRVAFSAGADPPLPVDNHPKQTFPGITAPSLPRVGVPPLTY
uniref:Uncharacterized protein n=1 Tax=Picea sitchensis TaxID=3332 RepID=A0A6B9XSA2_PICSI|nr:hypothetical protein Q903MT_gene6870 [Picea sitchensis]